MKKIYLLFLFFGLCITSYAQQTVGLFFNEPESYDGYTLFSPSSSNMTYLIDNCGFVVKTWQSNYPPGNSVYLLENGNLLRTARIGVNFNGGGVGGRIELYDWMGNLMWGFDYSTQEYCHHHDVAMLPNGNILLIAWERRSNVEAIAAGRNTSTVSGDVWSERVVEIKPIGTNDAEIVWEWKLWDHLVQDFDPSKANYGVVADHPELWDVNFGVIVGGGGSSNADWIHFNSINYNAELDQIILSSRHLHEIYIIDHSTTTAEAAGHTGGNSGMGGDILFRWGNPRSYDRGTVADQKLFGQHDAQWIPEGYPDEGKILVYNNGQNRPGGNSSSVDVIVPPLNVNNTYTISPNQPFQPNNLFWTYPQSPNGSFYSSNISGAHRLPNGNTLICEGREGHFFEVTMDGESVWDYKSPIVNSSPVQQGTNINNNSVFRAYRYGPDYPAFEGKILEPGDPIELNPLPSNCEIFTSNENLQILEGVKIRNNPFREYFVIENQTNEIITYEVYDLMGNLMVKNTSRDAVITHEAMHWANGMYVIRVFNFQQNKFFTEKIIKVRD